MPTWIKPVVVLNLDSLLKQTIPVLLRKAIQAFKDGKLWQPLDKTRTENARSSRSVSTSAVPSHRSGGTDSETFTSFNDTSTPSEKASNRSHLTRADHSSSERDLSLVLRKEQQLILERNKNYLDAAQITWDSNSSRSPNTSGSKDFGGNKLEHSFYDEQQQQNAIANANYYMTNNGCYYPVPVSYIYPQGYFQPSSVTNQIRPTAPTHQKYKKNVPPAPAAQTLNQQSKPFVPKREEIKKLDPAAPAFDQKKKQQHAPIKEEKKESPSPQNNTKAKNVRKPLGNASGNAAGNTIRLIINRNKLNTKMKSRELMDKRDLSDQRRAKSRDNMHVAICIDQDNDNDIQSDVYAPSEIIRRREIVKLEYFPKKNRTKRPVINQQVAILTKRPDPGIFHILQKIVSPIANRAHPVIRDRSLEAKEKISMVNVKELKKDINGLISKDAKKQKLKFEPKSRRREFEEDRAVQGRKLSFDMTKGFVRHPTPDHKVSIESEFS